jgi:hypothetical protein
VKKNREERDGRLGRLRKLNWDKEPSEKGMSRKWPTRLEGFEKCFSFV